ncbi:MAG: hypothetical protein IJJ94_02695 [Bacteroidaceae bacterium]|nr:hypothetical protein [Bacteroidaceae bacterium]
MKKYLVFGMMSAVALSFTACSSEEEVVANNPTFDGTSVKTEFALNVPTKVATRQQKAITQDGTDFRGINELYVAPFATAKQADNNPVKATDVKVGDVTLATFTAFDHTAAQDKWYNDITVPVGTNAFLVYAKPTVNGTDAANGALTMTPADPFAGIEDLKFSLKAIDAEYDLAAEGKAITDALTALAATEGVPSAGVPACAWSAVKAEDNQLYAELYANFASLKAGAAKDVKAYLETQLKPALIQNSGDANGIDVKLAAAVETAIAAIPETFPKAGIPDGAAVLKCEGGVFSFVTTDFITGEKWGANAFAYPAELWYRANTGIRVANEIKSTEVGTQDWATFVGSAYNAADNMVKASTQSVALLNPLQYGVANLETQIKFAAENLVVTKKVVTNQATGETTDETVESVPVNKLTLTGILVGDQKNVDWQFKPVAADPAVVVYDTDLIKTTFDATDYQTASQTLLCETTEDKQYVNVALEFVNGTEEAFTGVDGIVPVGAKFYLIGKLDITEAGKNWTAKTKGNEKLIFEQDFKTIAKFLINKLQGTAYNNIPDLRSPELELGLSVDLEWQEGYTFEIPVGE